MATAGGAVMYDVGPTVCVRHEKQVSDLAFESPCGRKGRLGHQQQAHCSNVDWYEDLSNVLGFYEGAPWYC